VWALGGGFAVMRGRTVLSGPMSFLSTADDKDKANVPWALLAGIVLLASLIGIGFTLLEHSAPLRELIMQAGRLRAGMMETLQVARFRGGYRLAAQGINEGIERAIEKSGGITRKPADLESILGPTPAQPAMSAFSFPLVGAEVANQAPASVPMPPRQVTVAGPQPAAFAPAPSFAQGTAAAPDSPLPSPKTQQPLPLPARPAAQGSPFSHLPAMHGFTPMSGIAPSDDEDATMVGAVPAELMAQATGEGRQSDETTEWLSVYDDFVRTKRQCGETVDGLTFEKFSSKLRSNRDTLVERHGCKRVKFSVYVKDGRASLKATPVKD
jgi:hypothetical protein